MKFQGFSVIGLLLWFQLPAHAQGMGSLCVKADPGRAGVFVDGKYLETLKALPLAKPRFGHLRTQSSDHFAAVYVNDRFMRHVDEFSNPFQVLDLNPGEYTVKIVPSTGQPITQTVKMEEGKTVIVK